MAAPMDVPYFRENGLTDTTGLAMPSSTAPKKSDADDVPDYNEAFPQLRSAGKVDANRSNTFFSSPFPSASNGNSSAGAMANTTTSAYSAVKNEEERRRTMAIHASSSTTKIVSYFQNVLSLFSRLTAKVFNIYRSYKAQEYLFEFMKVFVRFYSLFSFKYVFFSKKNQSIGHTDIKSQTRGFLRFVVNQ